MLRTTHTALAIWYAGSIGSLAFLPYIANILADRGVPRENIGWMMLSMPVAFVLGGPAWSWLADRTGRADVILKCATLITLLSTCALILAQGMVAQTLLLATLAFARAPLGPLGDAITLERLGGDRRSYGAVRMWGSVALLITAFAAGSLRTLWPVAPIFMGAGLILFAVWFAWTQVPGKILEAAPKKILGPLLRNPVILLFLIIATLHGVALTTYDNFFSLLTEELGFSGIVTGTAISTGVAAEIAVLGFGRKMLDTLGPRWLILIAVVSILPRFWWTGGAPTAGSLIVLQSLHGLSFGAFWIAGIALLSELSPPEAPNAGQSLLPASAFGAGHLAAVLLASFTLPLMPTQDLFQWIALGSLATTVLTLGFTLGPWKQRIPS